MYPWTKLPVAILCTFILSGELASADPLDEFESTGFYQQELQMQWDAGDYVAALHSAERIVKQSSTEDPVDLATPLHNLALVQLSLQQFDKSERNFTKAIELVEERKGQYAPGLMGSLSRLAIVHYQRQRYTDALELLRRAQHIAHRNDGVYTLAQLDLIDWITKVNLLSHQPLAADLQQRFSYKISVSNYGESDQQIIPAMSKMGNWFRDTGQYQDALKFYRKSLSVIEDHYGDRDLQLVSQLQAISSTMYLQGICCADKPLERALDIIVHEPGSDAADKLEAIMHLADMSLLTKKENKAGKLYKRAWNMLAAGGRINKKAEKLFAAPTRLGLSRVDVVSAFRQAEGRHPQSMFVKTIKLDQGNSADSFSFSIKKSKPRPRGLIGTPLELCYPQVLDLAKKDSQEDLSGYYMDLDFSVSQYGRVNNVAIIESNAPKKLGRYVKNILRYTRFRPRLKEGEPVVTNNLSLRQTFVATQNKKSDEGFPASISKTAVAHGCNLLAATSI